MTYEEANAAFDQAYWKYSPIAKAYTDPKIPIGKRPTQQEFEAAQADFNEAKRLFDEAFEKATGTTP